MRENYHIQHLHLNYNLSDIHQTKLMRLTTVLIFQLVAEAIKQTHARIAHKETVQHGAMVTVSGISKLHLALKKVIPLKFQSKVSIIFIF